MHPPKSSRFSFVLVAAILMGWMSAGTATASPCAGRQDAQADPIAAALARILAAKSAGAHASAVRELWQVRAQLPLVSDAALRARYLSQIDPLIRELDPAGKRRIDAHRKIAEQLRKLAAGYRKKGLASIAEAVTRRADRYDPAQAATRAASESVASKSTLRRYFEEADSIYDDVPWNFEGEELVSPLPQGDTHLLLARDEVGGDYTIRCEYRLAQGLGQFAVAYGYKSSSDFHIFEVDLREGSGAGCWFAHIAQNKPNYLFRSTRGLTTAQRKGWLPMRLEVRGEWMTQSIGAVHYSIKRRVPNLSGRFGFFLSGPTAAKEPVRIRNLTVSSRKPRSGPDLKAQVSDAERAESALVVLEKGEDLERNVRTLWRLQRGSLSGAEGAAPSKDLRKRIGRALMRHDPLELKRRQAGASVRRALGPIAKAYEAKKWFGAARDAWLCVVDADARNARRDLERLATVAPKAGGPAQGEKLALQTVEVAALLKGAELPWSKAAWTFEEGTLVAPKPGKEAQAVLSAKSYGSSLTLEAEVQLGVRGEFAFVFGFRGKNDFRCVYYSHSGREATRATVAMLKGEEWSPLSTQLTNVYAGEGRKAWIPVRIELRADTLVVGMGDVPARRVRLRSPWNGRIGFMIGSGSRAHQSQRVRKIRIRAAN